MAEYGSQVAAQLEYLPSRNPHDPAAMLVEAIRNNWAPPASYLKTQAETERMRQEAEDEQQRQQQRHQQQEQRQARQETYHCALERLSPAERKQREATARRLLQQDTPALAAYPYRTAFQVLLHEYIAVLLIPPDA